MTYQELDQWDSPNYTAAANCPAMFGEPRNPTTITIHHWGDPAWGQTFEGVVAYLCDGNRPNPTSAHFIVEAGRSACIVSPDDVAWHAGNAHGNATSIGIECNPNERDGDYQTIGEVIAHIRSIYGDLSLVPHNHWTQTDCPGTYDLARLDAIARGGTVQPASNGPVTPIQEDELTPEQAQQLAYISSPQFKADIFTGTSDLEKNARAAFVEEVLNHPVPRQGVDPKNFASPNTSVGAVVGWHDAGIAGTVGSINEHTDAAVKGIPTAAPAGGPSALTAADYDAIAARVVAAIKGQWDK